MTHYFVVFLPLAALAAQAPVLYKAASEVAPTPQRFIAPSLAEPAILNPPGFRWTPVGEHARYELEIARSPQFTGDAVRRYGDIRLNLFTPDRPLEPGRWYWRVRPAGGAWSEAREFHLEPGLPEIPVAPVPQLIARLRQNGYPRIFLTRGNLDEWRAGIRGPRAAEWKAFSAGLGKAAAIDASDPPKPAGSRRESAANNRMFTEAFNRADRVGEAIQSLALSCLLTGKAEHCDSARRLLLALASWDPQGSTDCRYNDTAFRGTIRGLARGYDWLNGAGVLNEADRRQVERVIAVRAEQYVEWYRRAQVSTRWPSTSHANGGVPYFGEMATAFAGALPQAEEWLRFFVYVVTANYPSFGRADGSWSEGGRYWHNTIGRHLFPVWGVSSSLGLNMRAHPFYVNGGYFKIYCNPPWDRMSPFGDAHNQPVGSSDARVVGILAQAYGNPEYAWYGIAARRGQEPEAPGSAADFLISEESRLRRLAGKADFGRLPLARVFPDTGLAALRTDLTDPAADIAFLIKSNPYGPVSHAHGDQGNFYLAAWGEPLLVPSGHYQGSHEVLFGSPHHAGWTWQSWAHNVPLVDGKGQAVRTPEAAGQVEHFYHSPSADYVRVDATRAYRARIGDEAVRTIGGFDKSMAARIGSAPVASYRRSVVFLRPGTFVLFDALEAEREVRLDWLLHSWNRFTIDEAQGRITASSGAARASVRLLGGHLTGITQTGDYLIPVPKDFRTQWHLDARFAPARAHHIVSVIHPYREGAGVPESEAAAGPGWSGTSLRWRDGRRALVAFAHASRPTHIAGSGTTATAAAFAQAGGWTYAAGATRIEAAGAAWEFSAPVDVLIEGGNITLTSDVPFEVRGRGRYPAGSTTLPLKGR